MYNKLFLQVTEDFYQTGLDIGKEIYFFTFKATVRPDFGHCFFLDEFT